MKNFKLIFLFSLTVIILSACGGGKQDVLLDPEIDATISVELGHTWNMSTSALSPDGKHMASSAYDGNLIVWEYSTKHQVMDFRRENSDASGNYISLKYTSDGKKLIAGSSNYKVDIFDIDSKSKEKTIAVDGYRGETLALSSDDKFIAIEGKDNVISLIDIQSGSVIKTFAGHSRGILSIAISPDNKFLGSASYDSTAIVWDIESGKELKRIDGEAEVNSISFNASSDKFAIAVEDLKRVGIYDLKSFSLVKAYEETPADQLIFTGKDLLIRKYSEIYLMNIETGEKIKSIESYGWDMAIQGDIISTAGSQGIEVYDFKTGTVISEVGQDTRTVSFIDVSPSGRLIVTANTHKAGSGGPDILSYPVDTSLSFTAYGTSGGDVGLYDFLGESIITEKLYGDIFYYDLLNGNSKSTIEDKITNPLDLTNDGTLLLAKDYKNKGSYGIYDPKTGELKTELTKNTSHLYFSGISPDDKYYVLLTMDFCKVFELPSGTEIKNYKREEMDNIVFFDITADGRYIVGQADSYNFQISDIMTGEVIFIVEKIEPKVAALNADKNTVAVGCSDWSVKVFDIAQNIQTQTLNGHNGYIKAVKYTPDGKYLITAGYDSQMKIWDLTGKELLTIVGLEKCSEYDGETKDFVVFAPNGRYDGTQAGIDQFLYFEKGGERVPASTYKEQCYTPNLLGRTLGQEFIETTETK